MVSLFLLNILYLIMLFHLLIKIFPQTYRQAFSHLGWRQAMDAELTALKASNTWLLSDLPLGKVSIDCKYVYKIKFHSNGSVERFKARLVVKGYTQLEGVDFHETFYLVAKLVTMQCLLLLLSKASIYINLM